MVPNSGTDPARPSRGGHPQDPGAPRTRGKGRRGPRPHVAGRGAAHVGSPRCWEPGAGLRALSVILAVVPHPERARAPGLQRLRPPPAAQLPPAHLGSTPPPPPPPPALCAPGSAPLGSGRPRAPLRGPGGCAGGGGGRNRGVRARARRCRGLRKDWLLPLGTSARSRPRPPRAPEGSAPRRGGEGGGSGGDESSGAAEGREKKGEEAEVGGK